MRPFARDDWVTSYVAGWHLFRKGTLAERKKKHLAKALYYAIHRSAPHTTFNHPALQSLFDPLHHKSSLIFSAATRPLIHSGVLELGEYGTTATKMERRRHLGSVTTNHWTGPGHFS